jgi:DNA-binding transcriptional ArsR family regulator
MVEYDVRIDDIFAALADTIRRDIFERTYQTELTVNQIASEYDISLAAVSRHLVVLLEADLIKKRKQGRFHFVSATPEAISQIQEYLKQFIEGDIYTKEEH